MLRAATLALVASCGYAPPRPVAPEGIRTIAVETFTSRAAHAAVGAWVAEAIREEILVAPSLRLAAASRADATLRGEVLSIDGDPAALGVDSAGPAAVLSGTTLVVRARLVRRNGELIADLGTLHARVTRSVSPFPSDDAARFDRAVRDAARDVGRRVVSVLLGHP